MIGIRVFATGLLAVACCGAAAAQSGMAELEALGSALRSGASWQADYTQEYVAAGMTSGDRIEGEVSAAWPDRALFVSGRPVSQMMGLEGRVVRLIDLEVASCDEHRLDDDEWARVPLAAVLDPATAVDRFTVLDNDGHGFALVPREPGGVDRVEVVLGDDNLPTEVVIVDPQGAVNRLRFNNWRASGDAPSGGWLPDPPPGIECVAD